MRILYKANLIVLLWLTMPLGSMAIPRHTETFSVEFKHIDDHYLLRFDDRQIELLKNDDTIFLYSKKKHIHENISARKELTDFQKESIELISTLSLRFILIAVGVFSLTGIFLLKTPTRFSWIGIPFFIIGSYIVLGMSIYYGYKVYGNMIWQLRDQGFNAFDEILRKDAIIQFYCFWAGGLTFIGAIFLNFIIELIRRCRSKKASRRKE